MGIASIEQSARLAIVGQTCASLLRDMTTPLNLISMLAEGAMLQLQLPDTDYIDKDEIEQTFNQIIAQTRRLGNMVTHLTQLARARSPNERENTNINTVVKNAIQLKKNKISLAGVHLRLTFAKDVPLVCVDPFHIEQILLNLVNNAIDALDQYQREVVNSEWIKEIHITTKVEKEQIIVEVVDNGCGINKEDHGHVFDLFFTTKGDKGTGLGLYTSREIARQYDGDIEFVSTNDKGAAFRFWLPVMEAR